MPRRGRCGSELGGRGGPRLERLRWHATKAAAVAGAAAITVACYLAVAEATLARSTTTGFATPLDGKIPFVPWTWWLYFPSYVASLLLAAAVVRERTVFARALAAMLLAQGLCAIVFWFVPSSFPRPVDWKGAGLTADALHWMWRVDPPNNTFPSVHVALSTLAALAMWEERNPFRYVSMLLALGVVVTVHTTKQHYWLDTAGGAVVAAVCFWLAFRVYPAVCHRSRTLGGVRPIPWW